jgi:hypothetical protein
MRFAREEYEHLLFLEAILWGVYGNWLVWFIDKINLSPDIYFATFQFVLIVVSIFSFIGYLGLSVFAPLRLFANRITMFFHLICLWTPQLLGHPPEEFPLLPWWYFVLGVTLFFFIYYLDTRRNLMRQSVTQKDMRNILFEIRGSMQALENQINELKNEVRAIKQKFNVKG